MSEQTNTSPSMPLRDIELKKYTIQGKDYMQRKPSFDFRLKELNIKLGHAWDMHYRNFLKDTFKEIAEKRDSFKKAYEYLEPSEIELIFSVEDTPERNAVTEKLNRFGNECPVEFKDFIESFNMIISDSLTAMQLFIIVPDNKKKLFDLCLEGDLSAIHQPETFEEDEELERVGRELLNFFVSKLRISTKSLSPLKTNTVSIN
jgi:hypothetical protein